MEHVLDNVAGEKLVASIRRSHLEGRSAQDMTRQYSLEEEYLLPQGTIGSFANISQTSSLIISYDLCVLLTFFQRVSFFCITHHILT
jgi:hypothetical protein